MSRTARRLLPADAEATARLLDQDPVQNAYLRSEVRLHALRSGSWWGVDADGGLGAVLLSSALAVPWVPDLKLAGAMAPALGQQPAPRMLVGPAEQVRALHAARKPVPRLREVRDPQPLMVLGRGELHARASRHVRRATTGDLEALTLAAAAMHREEMGVDPLVIDAVGWRARMSQLVGRGWSWVWMADSKILFKAELSAWTPEVVQVQGVYTDPQRRGEGIATAGLAAVCQAILAEVPLCSLYVNHYNAAARAVYDRLGFRSVASFATLIF